MECTRLRVKAVAIPSIGAGQLNYPTAVVAKTLIEEAFSYMEKNSGTTTLERIHFVVYEQNAHNEFTKVLFSSSRPGNQPSPIIIITKGSITDYQVNYNE